MIHHLTTTIKKLENYNLNGIATVKDLEISFDSSSFTIRAFSVLLVKEGNIKLLINDTVYALKAYDLFAVSPGHLCYVQENQAALCVHSCFFNEDYANNHLFKNPQAEYFNFFVRNSILHLHLGREKFSAIERTFRLHHQKLNNNDSMFGHEAKKISFNLFICELSDFHAIHNNSQGAGINKNERLLFQFYKLLYKNIKKQHKVQFYADALYMTAGHLNKIIKQLTNKTVKQVIEEALIAEAKNLLQNNELTILEITEELEFSTISFFSGFFKKHTATTPSNYRQFHNC